MASSEGDHGDSEEFKPGEMIMHHIGDTHEWHVVGNITVPLPIILYHPEKGLSVFMSSKFEHGAAIHNGYGIHHEHIFVADSHGHEDETATADLIDLSMTKNVVALLVSIFLLFWILFSASKASKRNKGKAPKGIQNIIEIIVVFVRDDIAKMAIGEKKYEKFMPFLLTVFFFIWINNIMGLIPLIPGGANVTGNIAIPLVLAGFTFVITNINGNKNYWRHTFAMPGVPIGVLIILTPIEIAQLFIRPIVLIIRLFANILAGHIGMLVFFSLIFIFSDNGNNLVAGYGVSVFSVAFTIFLNFLELLVGAIQAYVFTLLSAIYFGMAVQEDHH
jgi:F-type H+-transporting ATPase subunit a